MEVAMLLHHWPMFGRRTAKFFPVDKLAQLKLRCIHHLIGGWGIGFSADEDLTHEEILTDAKQQPDLAVRGTLGLRLDTGKTSCGMEGLNALPNSLAFKRSAGLLRDQFEQTLRPRRGETWKINAPDDKPLVRSNRTDCRHRRQLRFRGG